MGTVVKMVLLIVITALVIIGMYNNKVVLEIIEEAYNKILGFLSGYGDATIAQSSTQALSCAIDAVAYYDLNPGSFGMNTRDNCNGANLPAGVEIFPNTLDIHTNKIEFVTQGDSIHRVVVDCTTGSGSCEVKDFYLPQEGGASILRDTLKGVGDPIYLVYYESFPKGEDTAWLVEGDELAVVMILFGGFVNFIGPAGGAGLTKLSNHIVGKSMKEAGEYATKEGVGSVTKTIMKKLLVRKMFKYSIYGKTAQNQISAELVSAGLTTNVNDVADDVIKQLLKGTDAGDTKASLILQKELGISPADADALISTKLKSKLNDALSSSASTYTSESIKKVKVVDDTLRHISTDPDTGSSYLIGNPLGSYFANVDADGIVAHGVLRNGKLSADEVYLFEDYFEKTFLDFYKTGRITKIGNTFNFPMGEKALFKDRLDKWVQVAGKGNKMDDILTGGTTTETFVNRMTADIGTALVDTKIRDALTKKITMGHRILQYCNSPLCQKMIKEVSLLFDASVTTGKAGLKEGKGWQMLSVEWATDAAVGVDITSVEVYGKDIPIDQMSGGAAQGISKCMIGMPGGAKSKALCAAATAIGVASIYEDSVLGKAIPVQLNEMALKKPYNDPYTYELSPESDEYYIRLKKTDDAMGKATNFFLASPCKINLKVTTDTGAYQADCYINKKIKDDARHKIAGEFFYVGGIEGVLPFDSDIDSNEMGVKICDDWDPLGTFFEGAGCTGCIVLNCAWDCRPKGIFLGECTPCVTTNCNTKCTSIGQHNFQQKAIRIEKASGYTVEDSYCYDTFGYTDVGIKLAIFGGSILVDGIIVSLFSPLATPAALFITGAAATWADQVTTDEWPDR